MPKFSIIVPVYNTSIYLKKCLDSIANQTYKDYEIIIVNDGSTDNSLNIINEYKNKFKNCKIINQKNQGLSVARNNGIKESDGDYFLLIDSDDYVDKYLLEKLNDNITNNPDLVRFQMRTIEDSDIIDFNEEKFTNKNGIEAFETICTYHFVEPACCYLYKAKYYKENKFNFEKNCYHEDFGLIPLVIIKANKVNSINYIGYNYVQRNNSIMNDDNYEKKVKKAFDVLKQYNNLIKYNDNTTYQSFLANSVILELKNLKGKEYKKYLQELKNLKVFDKILTNTISRKIKKIILKINPKLYLKMR